LAFSTCPPWPCASSIEMARTCAGLPFRLRLGSGDLGPDPRDLRLSFRDTFRFARSFSLVFRAVSEELARGLLLRLRSIRRGSGLLSWGCQISPLRRHACPASTPGRELAPRSLPLPRTPKSPGLGFRSRPSARRCHPSSAFRPCRSSRLRRFAPLGRLRVCCTPQPTMGFAMFQVSFIASLGTSLEERGPHARCAVPPKRLSLPLPRRGDAPHQGGAREPAPAPEPGAT
jgi:hypothetical protein